MILFLILLLVGIISATFGSIVGLGGGAIIVPALIYLSPLFSDEMSASTAVGTSLTVLIFTAMTSTLTYIKKKRVDFKSGWLFFITSGPAAIIGALLTGALKQYTFELAFGIFMLLMAGLLLSKDYIKPLTVQWKIQRTYTDVNGNETHYGYNIIPALALGFGVGIISGLFGIGGGALFVPLMVLIFRYPPHVAAATSMFVIFLSAILGSLTHITLGEIDWLSVLALAPGALLGGWMGARIASHISSKGLIRLLIFTLIVLAIRMIWP